MKATVRFTAFALLIGSLVPLGAAQAQSETLQSWTERVKLDTDFRYRQEYIREEKGQGQPDSERHRGRIRARLGIEGQVNDEVKIGFKIATSNGGQRNSYNQDLGDNGDKKDLYLDLAFVEWNPSERFMANIGKFQNPFVTVGASQLIWDVDYTAEGASFNYNYKTASMTYEARLGTFWMVERNGTEKKDSGMLGAQLGASFDSNIGKFGLYISNYTFTNFAGQTPVEASGLGNTLDAGGALVNDYNLVNLGLVYGTTVFDLPFEVYVDIVQNSELSKNEKGYLAGFNFGKLKERHDWRVSYNFRDTEADAVLAGLQDSDFAGGSTDAKGHSLTLSYGLSKGINTAVTYYMIEKGFDNRDYDRVHLDLNVKF